MRGSTIPEKSLHTQTTADLEPQASPPLIKPHTAAAPKIPDRPLNAMTGREFLEATANLSLADREARIEKELSVGNVPTFLRKYLPVEVDIRDEMRVLRTGWVFVMPDYLAIGSDEDFVRIPMTPVTAQRIANRFEALLPTSAIVNAVFNAAEIKLNPRPLPPSLAMRANEYFRRHEDMVTDGLKDQPRGVLVAGHKKDVVIANRLKPGRVAIYGWHLGPGEPIQPLSSWHRESYSDYSHGVRLVHNQMLVGTDVWPTKTVLQHPQFSALLSFEGRLRKTEAPIKNVEWTIEEIHAPYNTNPPNGLRMKRKFFQEAH